MADEKTKAKTKEKPKPKPKEAKPEKKAEKKEPTTWSSRLGYPIAWHEGVKKLAAEKNCRINQIYQFALKDYLFKHNLLPSQNNNKS